MSPEYHVTPDLEQKPIKCLLAEGTGALSPMPALQLLGSQGWLRARPTDVPNLSGWLLAIIRPPQNTSPSRWKPPVLVLSMVGTSGCFAKTTFYISYRKGNFFWNFAPSKEATFSNLGWKYLWHPAEHKTTLVLSQKSVILEAEKFQKRAKIMKTLWASATSPPTLDSQLSGSPHPAWVGRKDWLSELRGPLASVPSLEQPLCKHQLVLLFLNNKSSHLHSSNFIITHGYLLSLVTSPAACSATPRLFSYMNWKIPFLAEAI